MAFIPTHKLKYIPPNLITCSGMVLGLLSAWFSLTAQFEWAAWVILWCALLDRLDGLVARAFKATSKIGMELDSFSDFTTFGIAPAFFVFSLFANRYADSSLRVMVYVGAPIFVVCAALRLAKFNVTTEEIGDQLFLGIPTTLVGVLLSTGFLTGEKYGAPAFFFQAMPIVMIVLGILMISTIKLPKLKRRENKALDYFQTANMLAGFVFGWLRILPEYIFFISIVYIVVGVSYYLLRPPAPKGPEPTPA